MISYASRRRRRRAAFRQLRRLSPAGARTPALAHRPAERPRAARRCAAEDPGALRAGGGIRPGARRPAVPAAAVRPRRHRRRRVPDLFDRISRHPGAGNWRASSCSAWPTMRRSAPAKRSTGIRPRKPRSRPARCRRGCRSFARDALRAALKDPLALDRALGEYLSEPKASVWFEAGAPPRGFARGRAGPAHAHDVRQASCLHQRRELSRLGPGRRPAARAGRPRQPGTAPSWPTQAKRRARSLACMVRRGMDSSKGGK